MYCSYTVTIAGWVVAQLCNVLYSCSFLLCKEDGIECTIQCKACFSFFSQDIKRELSLLCERIADRTCYLSNTKPILEHFPLALFVQPLSTLVDLSHRAGANSAQARGGREQVNTFICKFTPFIKKCSTSTCSQGFHCAVNCHVDLLSTQHSSLNLVPIFSTL